jgi:hypothetical protein
MLSLELKFTEDNKVFPQNLSPFRTEFRLHVDPDRDSRWNVCPRKPLRLQARCQGPGGWLPQWLRGRRKRLLRPGVVATEQYPSTQRDVAMC